MSNTRKCERDTCSRSMTSDTHTACSGSCSAIHREMKRAERIYAFTADEQHRNAFEALESAFNEYRASELRVFNAARDVGIDSVQWKELVSGNRSKSL